MSKIFMSYRRADSETAAGRIYDHLVREFGSENVFKDTSLIRPGDDFRGKIREYVSQCDVLLVIIGNQWLKITESPQSSERRLDNPEDWVRIEIESGLQRAGVRVIPLLVQGASMPAANDLPPTLRELAFKNKIDIHEDPLFQSDVKRLMDDLAKDSPKTPQTVVEQIPPQKASMSSRNKVALVTLVALALIIVLLIVIVPNLMNQPQAVNTVSPTTAVVSTSAQAPTASLTLDPSPASVSSAAVDKTLQPPVSTQIIAPSSVNTPSGKVQLSLIASENSLVLYVPQSVNLTGLQLTVFISNVATPFLFTDYFDALKLVSGVAQNDSCYVLELDGSAGRLPLACQSAGDGGRVFKQQLSGSDRFWYDGLRNSQRDLVIYKDGKSLRIACPASQPTCKFDWEF